MVDVHRLVARELELPADLLALVRLRLLLRHADKHDAVADPALLPESVGYLVLPFLMAELVHRDLLSLRHRLHVLTEFFRDLAQHYWRRNRLAQLLAHKAHQAAGGSQWPDVPVQVQSVQTLHFQSHMTVEEFRDARHHQILRNPAALRWSV